MSMSGSSKALQELCSRIQECILPFAGRVEYGNLRYRISEWEGGNGDSVTNIALVYETPGGSTDQINISFHHTIEQFSLVDVQAGEVMTDCIESVLESVRPRISGIPEKRLETLFGEIRRQIDGGSNHAGLFGHLNRMIQSEFKGGTITHLELRDAMTYAVKYMKERQSGSPAGAAP